MTDDRQLMLHAFLIGIPLADGPVTSGDGVSFSGVSGPSRKLYGGAPVLSMPLPVGASAYGRMDAVRRGCPPSLRTWISTRFASLAEAELCFYVSSSGEGVVDEAPSSIPFLLHRAGDGRGPSRPDVPRLVARLTAFPADGGRPFRLFGGRPVLSLPLADAEDAWGMAERAVGSLPDVWRTWLSARRPGLSEVDVDFSVAEPSDDGPFESDLFCRVLFLREG